jgi:MFS family permease
MRLAPPVLPRPSVRLATVRDAQGFRAFHHRNYRLFWIGQLISLVGTWMQTVAQGWLVLQLTNDPFALGLLSVAQFGPVMILGLFGGVIADSLPKRQTLVVTQATQMVLAFVLAALVITGTVEVWHILVLALLLGCSNAIDMPVRQSFTVEMVGREDVANAVAHSSAIFNGARVIGPAVAGITIGVLGLGPCFLLNGISFIAVIIGLLAMRDGELHVGVRARRPHSVGAVFDDLAEGLGYVRRTPIVLLAIATVGLTSTFAINWGVSVPPMVRDVLQSDAAGYGFIMAVTGIGSLIGALYIAFTGRASVKLLIGGTLSLSVLFTIFGLSRSYPLSMLCMFGAGAGMIAMAASANTLIQLTVPDHLRGRVMSVYTTVFAGSTPIGGLATGALASTYGIAFAVILGGALSVLVGLGGILYAMRHPHLVRARAAPAAAPIA